MTTGDLDVKAILERAEAATPGPWHACLDSHAPGNGKTQCWLEADDIDLNIEGPHSAYREFDFVASARTDVPALCAEVERLRGENICDACVGGHPISGIPCMCGGSGKMSDAARYLREQVVKLEAKVQAELDAYEKLLGELENVRIASRRLVAAADEGQRLAVDRLIDTNLPLRNELAASAEALRVAQGELLVERANMASLRAYLAKGNAREMGILDDNARMLGTIARLEGEFKAANDYAFASVAAQRALTDANERLRAALKKIESRTGPRVRDYRSAIESVRDIVDEALAPTPTGGKEHE